ncbi:DUF4064 domain-containing protein [Lysinibacillus sp. SGAir0095]|uniref:DUF4064 domain-containing protein n=1 Tax=Lysinibacillus sp. SGAir0095 TaxID=2070463 RepID=UPI0010CCE9F2|nr:DUF4064 domain-containing protein [Lysinibacillus sp. SGAir0095]QCR32775.1 hypothetical protein C1N55_11590 [Lysinibacillus sp. SGAir0095]
MKRTGERVLSIIATILNVLAVGFLIVMLFGGKMLIDTGMNDPLIQSEMESQMYASGLTEAEIDEALLFMDDFISFISGIGWIFVVLGIIAIILGVIGAVKVNKNAKLAGILFIIAAVLSGIISLQGILLIIAAIMCFVRKPKSEIPLQKTDENGYVIE